VGPGGPILTAPRVVVADDDVLLREGLAGLLGRSGFAVVGQAGNAVELLALVRATTPDVAIVDIRMPPGGRLGGGPLLGAGTHQSPPSTRSAERRVAAGT
jgi:DNA-binding NarL/FixJ family response regulator